MGNKLEIEKGQNVQGLREITLKSERISGIWYHHFLVKMAFKVYGDKKRNVVMVGGWRGWKCSGFMGEVHSKNDFFEISMKYNYFSVRKGKIEFRKDQKQI